MNRSALLAILTSSAAVIAVVMFFVVGGQQREAREAESVITSQPQDPATPTPSASAEGEDPLPQDDSVSGIVDTAAEEAAAERAAVEWVRFDSEESTDARAARLVAVGAAAELAGSAPDAARVDELDGLVDATSTVTADGADLVALDDFSDTRATFSVFVTVTAVYAQPGSSQTFVDRTELLVTVDRTAGNAVVAISER